MRRSRKLDPGGCLVRAIHPCTYRPKDSRPIPSVAAAEKQSARCQLETLDRRKRSLPKAAKGAAAKGAATKSTATKATAGKGAAAKSTAAVPVVHPVRVVVRVSVAA